MSDTFLNSLETENGKYTNMVTADDLNNIAKDLGIPEYSYFPEEPPESAVSALNQITKDLTSKGILRIGNECNVSISEDVIYVSDGVCVFDTGAKKRINETDIASVNFLPGATNYVYFIHNETDNKIQLVSSHEEPTIGNFVMLAEIDAEKTILDRRYWSVSKISNGINRVLHVNQKMTFSKTFEDRKTYAYDIKDYGGNFIIIHHYGVDYSQLIAFPLNESTPIHMNYEIRLFEYVQFVKEGSMLYVEPYRNNERIQTINEVEFWIV